MWYNTLRAGAVSSTKAIVIEPCEEGGFHAWVPSLPGCHSEGETEKEAVQNIQEAIELYLDADDEELPGPPVKKIEVAF